MSFRNPINPVRESGKRQSSLLWLTTEWYPVICDGGFQTLGTSGGARVPIPSLTNPDRPCSYSVSENPIVYPNRASSWQFNQKFVSPQSAEACVATGQLLKVANPVMELRKCLITTRV